MIISCMMCAQARLSASGGTQRPGEVLRRWRRGGERGAEEGVGGPPCGRRVHERQQRAAAHHHHLHGQVRQ